MKPRYYTSNPDRWTMPRQRRHDHWGHGPIRSILEDYTLWSCIRTGLGWMVGAVWGVATAIAVIVAW